MADNEEIEPISDNQNISSPIKSLGSDQTFSYVHDLLIYLEEKTKLVLCIILLSMLAAGFIFVDPLPKQFSKSDALISSVDSAFDSSQTFPQLVSHQVKQDQNSTISLLSQSVRETLNEMLNKKKLTEKQLKGLRDIMLQKKKQIDSKYEFHQKRSDFFNEKSRYDYFKVLAMGKFNIERSEQSFKEEKKKAQRDEFSALDYNYNLSQVKEEIPICIVVYATETKKKYASQYFLTSLFNQNYSNFKAVLVYDDVEVQSLSQWKSSAYYANSSKFQLTVNQQKLGYWQSIKNVINGPCCGNAQVIALMNGNDELLGFNVLKVFNSVYQRKGANVVYSNFIEHHREYQQMFRGFSDSYSADQISNTKYRQSPVLFGSMLTFKKQLFNWVNDKSIIFSDQFQTEFSTQIALYFSLLELSCGKVQYIAEYFYLFEGYKFDKSKNNLDNFLLKLKTVDKYRCYKFMGELK